jgi:OFA family oxalate/formate antiporter-like MFS transporter
MINLHRLAPPFAVCFCAGALYGWSALAAPLQAAFDLRLAQAGLVFSLALVAFTGAVIAAPYVGARLGHMRMLAVCAGLGALFTALAAFAQSFAVFTALFSLGFGAMSGAIYSTALGLAAASASARIATPVMVAGFGLGGAVFGPLWKLLSAQGWGLSALLPFAGALAISGVLAALASANSGPKLRTPERIRTSAPLPRSVLALIWAIFATGTFGGLMVLGLAARIMDVGGAALTLTGAVLVCVALANTLGRLSAAAALGTGPALLGAGLVCIAAGYGLMASCVPLITAKAVGPAKFQRAFGIVFTAWGASGFAAPWLAGLLYDLRGDFALAYGCATVATLLCAPLIWALRARINPAL